ncbi:trichohyalin isoform X1 [Haplochromis burtoni]|uniref:trichohyalin isoform X1 n=1 Tax=Haplochromis burtoni TaxID=8153 RepID=UPI001C2D5D1E|nr:trichohyalin isoform X1 [Haplochromis burtoni]
MKTWVNKWISAQSTIKHTFSVNASKLQESQYEIDTDSLEDQTSAIPKDKRGTESITDTTSLQNSVTLDDQHQNKKIKEQQKEHFESKYCFAEGKNGEQDFCLQMRTEIHEEVVHDKTELLIIVREREEVEKLIRNLKQQEGEIKEQIKYTIDNMKEKTQDIKRLILEINDLQRADTVITVGETENAQEVLTKLLEETEQRKILMVNTKVFKNEIMKYEVQEGDDAKKIKQESSLIRLNVNKQKLIQKSGEEMKKHVEHTDEDKKDRGADIQRLRAEIYKTQEIIRTLRGGLENLAEKNNMDKYQQNEGSEIEGLLKDIKQFQEFLEIVKTKIKQSEVHMTEEMSNIKSMKTAVKKKRREVDQRLENTLKERDGLDIFKIKMQRQTELIRQNLEKMAKVKSTVEKIAAKTRRKIEEIEISMKETEIKLRQFKDLDCINLNLTKGAKPDMEHGITPKQRTALEIFKTEIKKTMDNKRDKLTKNKMDKETEGTESLKQVNEKLEEVKLSLESLGQKNKKSVSENVKQIIKREETEMTEQIQTAIKNEKMVKQLTETEIQEEQVNHLREKTERHKQELDDGVHMTKRQIREMELLQSELKIKVKEFERFFRKSMRKKEEIEIMWYEIQQEKEALRTEIKKKRRELDQRLEMTMRKRDELEVLRVKLKRQMEELAEEKQRDHNLFIHLPNEHEKHFGRKDVKMLMEKIKKHSLKVSQYTIYIQDIRDKFNLHMGTIRTEMKILENVNAHLEKDRKGFREVEAENKNITNKMKRLKYQLNILFGRVTIQDTAEMDETINIWEKIQREKQKLDMRLENIKRERQEIEALVVELEMKKRENQRVIKRSIQKEQKIKRIWATFKEERTALVRETKQKKEVEQQREEIIKHQGEQEIKQKLQKEKKRMQSEIEDMRMKEKRKQIQKQWELIKKYLGEYKKVIKNTQFIIGIIQNENKHMQDQKNFYMTTRKETLNIKSELNRQKEIIRCTLKNIQQEPKHGEQVETKIKTEQGKHENGRKKIYEKEKDALDDLSADESQDKEDLERVKELLKKNQKLDMRGCQIKKEIDILKQKNENIKEERKTTEIKETEKKMKLKDFNKMFWGKQKEKHSTEYLTVKKEYERETIKDGIKRVILQDTKKDLIKKEIKKCNQEKEKVIQMKTRRENRKELLLKVRRNIKDEEKEMEMRGDQVMDEMKSLEILKVKLQQLKEDIKAKMDRLLQNVDNRSRLQTVLEEKLATQDELKESIRCFTEMLEREKEGVRNILSDMVTKRECTENEWKQQFELDKRELDKVKEDLRHDREDLERESEVLNKEKMDLKVLMSDIKKQFEILEEKKQNIKEERDSMEIIKLELLNKMEHVNKLLHETNDEKAKIKNCILQVQMEKERLEDILSKIFLTHNEEKVKEDDLRRQTKEVEIMKKELQSERAKVESLMRNLKKKQEELERAKEIMSEEKEEMKEMKTDIAKERELLLKERRNMEEEWSEMEMRGDQVMDEMKSLEILKVKLQQLKEDIKAKMERLLQNVDNRSRLQTVLEEKLATQDELKESIRCFTEMLEREKEGVRSILSDMVTKRECTENEWKQQFELDKRELDKLKEDLRHDREDLERESTENEWKKQFELDKRELDKLKEDLRHDREDLERESEVLNKEKMDLKVLMSDIKKQFEILEEKKQNIKEERDSMEIIKLELLNKMEHVNKLLHETNDEKAKIKNCILQVQMEKERLEDILSKIFLTHNEEKVKEDDLRRQTKEVEIMKKELQSERAKVESLMRNLKKKQEELERAKEIMSEEKEEMKEMKTDIAKERELLLKERRNMEEEWSEMEMRGDQVMDEMKSLEILKVKLQQLKEDIKAKMERLLQNVDNRSRLQTVLEEKLATQDELKESIRCFTEMLEREKEGVRSILSDMVTKRECTENEWKQQFELDKRELDKLKEDLRHDREDLERESTENEWKKQFELDKRELDKLKEDLRHDREDLERESEVLNKEKMDLKVLMSDIKKQFEILEEKKRNIKEERDSMEIIKLELLNKMEHVNKLLHETNDEKAKIKNCILQVQMEKERLEDILSKIFLTHNEEKVKEDDLRRQTKEVEIMKKELQSERAKVESLMRNLKKKQEELERAKEIMSEEKEEMKEMKTDIAKEQELLLKERRNVEEEQSGMEMRGDQVMDEMKSLEILKVKLIARKSLKGELSDVQPREDILSSVTISTRNLIGKLNRLIHQELSTYIKRVEGENEKILQVISIYEQNCVRIHKQKIKITADYDKIQQQKKHVFKTTFDKAIQTEEVVKQCLHEHQDEETNEHEFKQRMKDVAGNLEGSKRYLTPDKEGLLLVGEGEEFETVKKTNLATLSILSAEEDDFTQKGTLKTEFLKQIWKDTRIERNEINQMKLRGQKMRNNMDKRVKVINHFVRRSIFQKEKTSVEKTRKMLEHGQSNTFLSVSGRDGEHKSLDEKYTELQQLKVRMLSEIEKFYIQNKASKTLTTSNKANQTVQLDSPNIYQEQIKVEESEAAPERSPGLLSQLRLSCYRCCSRYCAYCKQGCPKKK